MLKIERLFVIIGLWSLLFSTISFAFDIKNVKKTNFKTVVNAIVNNMRGTNISSISKTPIDGLYQVVAGRNVFYSNAKGRYLFFGHIYDLKNQDDLTEDVQRSLIPKPHINWHQLPKYTIVAGHSEVKLAIVLDPICPYCKALEKELMPLTEIKDTFSKKKSSKKSGKKSSKKSVLEIHYYLMPLSEIHPNSSYLASQIWCSTNRLTALHQVLTGKKLLTLSRVKPTCDLTILNNMQKFFKKNHFDYTPTLIREDGMMKFGYLDKDEIVAWLNEYYGKVKQTNKKKEKRKQKEIILKVMNNYEE